MRPIGCSLGLTEGSLEVKEDSPSRKSKWAPEPKVVPAGTQGTPLDTPMSGVQWLLQAFSLHVACACVIRVTLALCDLFFFIVKCSLELILFYFNFNRLRPTNFDNRL